MESHNFSRKQALGSHCFFKKCLVGANPFQGKLKWPLLPREEPLQGRLWHPLHSYCGNGLCKLCPDKSCLISSLPLSQSLCCVSFWAVLAQSLAQPSRGFQNAHPCVVGQPGARAYQGKSIAPLGFFRLAGSLGALLPNCKGPLGLDLPWQQQPLLGLLVCKWLVLASGSPPSLGEGKGKQKSCPGAPLGHTPSTCPAKSCAGLGLGYAGNL